VRKNVLNSSSCYKSVSGTLMPFGNEHGGAYFGVVCFCVLDGRSTRNTPYCFSSMISRTQTNFDSSIFF
jgi:hypothetical protein